MFLTVHTAVAVAISQVAPTPLAGFSFGLLSHFALDAIPHGDYELSPWVGKGATLKKRILLLVGLDFLVMFVVAVASRDSIISLDPRIALPTVLGAVLPDFLEGVKIFLNSNVPLVREFSSFHTWIQRQRFDHVPFRWGIVIQLLVLAGMLTLFLNS